MTQSREDIAQEASKRWEAFLAHPPTDDKWRYAIRTTSGTTGQPLMMVRKMQATGMRRYSHGRDVLLCLGSRNVRLANIRTFRHNPGQALARIIAIDYEDLRNNPQVFEGVSVDYICGISSFIRQVALVTSEQWRRKVKTILCTSEFLSQQTQNLLSKSFPQASFTMEYISSETGSIGYSCPYLKINQYHLNDGVSVVLQDVDQTGVGNLLVTTQSGDFPVNAYAIGDSARLIQTPCSCGKDIILEHAGRTGYDYIKIGGAIIRKEEFDRVASFFLQQFQDYRVEIREHMTDSHVSQVALHLRVYSERGAGTALLAAEIAAQFATKVFLTKTQTLSELIAKGSFLPLTLSFESKPFQKKGKEVKLIKL